MRRWLSLAGALAALAGACSASSGGAAPSAANDAAPTAAGGSSGGTDGAGGSSVGATEDGGAGASGASGCTAAGAVDTPVPDGGSSSCAIASTHTGDLPCDVSAVLQAKCRMCHTCPNQCGAHFPLRSYEDLTQPFTKTKLRWQRAAEVVDPTNPDGVPHMPYQNAPQLTDAELATLEGWFQAGAPPLPEGMGCDTGD